ncbi:hypothetical protein BD324DRAFT_652475 [Kockovaella imperatae]|uniref:DUF4185 domain-containing protein n=1 Tax=Kockovaella imperatae TaxID=4999 RepID=A0A1Y1UBC1_9TREE|nr:hypothetical protein BD324DRAFT_652475 [Kockovaella imperatae]ORX35340.1 hypothetical protein BD324DRAFT_652475 [Kockovaella imperatae]
MFNTAKSLLVIGGALASAAPTTRGLLTPTLLGEPQTVAITLDPNLQRDSCVSTTELVDGRVFWLCRDSIILRNQNLTAEIKEGLFQGGALGLVASTGSWSNQTLLGPELQPIPAGQGQTQVTDNYQLQLTQYGGESNYFANEPYVYYEPNECNGIPAGSSQGNCNDGTRIPLWPDSPAIVTSVDGETTTMHFYIKVPHIYDFLGTVDYYPFSSLYKLVHNHGDPADQLPTISLVDEYFWPRGAFAYGDFANVKQQGSDYLYLWGQSSPPPFFNVTANQTQYPPPQVGLARVPIDSTEDKSAYQYYYPASGWSSTQPLTNTTSAFVDVGGVGGGTIIWSDLYQTYLWFSQLQGSGVAELYLTTSTTLEGPWPAATYVATFPQGNSFAYSLAAHPEMSLLPNEFYFTYTQQVDYPGTTSTVYAQPLMKLTFA